MKTEAIERLINAVDVWVAVGVFENTVFSPITDDAKKELKAINYTRCCTELCYEDIESAKCLTCGDETCLDAECLQ